MLAGLEAQQGKPYSMDLRGRVVTAVEIGGMSCHQAAAQFGHGDCLGATPARDRQRCAGADRRAQAEGNFGRVPCLIAGAQERTKARDFTLRGLVAELAERGLKIDYRAV